MQYNELAVTGQRLGWELRPVRRLKVLPRYSAGMGKVNALNSIFPTLFAFRFKALNQASGGLGCFFTV